MKKLLIALIALGSISIYAASTKDKKILSAPSMEGLLKIKAGKMAEAQTLLRPEADSGNKTAQFFMGLALDGNDDASKRKALSYYKKSSDQKHPPGMFYYAGFLEHGLGGIPKDLKKALELYKEIQRSPEASNFEEIVDHAKSAQRRIERTLK